MNRLLLAVALLLATAASSAYAQAGTTASRLADLQLGGGFTLAHSDYVPNTIRGFALYGDFDIRGHYGIEAGFHRVVDPNSDPLVPSNHFSETTYEIGGRYLRRYRRYAPYGKVLYGRSIANFPAHQVFVPGGLLTYINNLAYNSAILGGGLDYRLTPCLNLRGDFEFQHWFASDAELPSGLSPMLFTVGVAYHFPARPPKH